MPNGTDTVRVQLPNGQTGTIPRSSLPAAQRKGWKVVDSPLVAGAKTFGREAALGGFSGLGIAETQTPLQDTAKNWLQSGAHPDLASIIFGPAADVTRGLGKSASDIFEGLGADPKHPLSFGQTDVGKVGHGLGSMITQLLTLRGGEKVAEKPFESGAAKGVLREAWGVGKRDVEAFNEAAAAREAKKIQASAKKVEAAKQSHAELIQDTLKKRAEASAKESAAKTKQQALSSEHGPVYKRMNEMADDIQSHVEEIGQKVNKAESEKWNKFSEDVGNPKVATQPVADAITNVQKNILTGDSVPVFKQVLHQITQEAEGGPEFIDSEIGLTPKTGEVPLDAARRLYTKIGRKLGERDLPPPMARALGTVQEALDSSIAESVTKSGGADALTRYRKLQADWKQYRQTFTDKDSPLRHIVEAKDPGKKIGPIVGDTGARAVDYLGRYKNMGADPSKIGKLRALDKALRELPAGGGKAPAMPAREAGTLPKQAEPKLPTTEEARRQMLKSRAKTFSGPPRRFELFIPPLYAFRMLLKKLSQSPKFIEYLSREGKGGSSAVPGGAAKGMSADAMFEQLFGKEYREAGDLAEWETGSREGGPITGGWSKR